MVILRLIEDRERAYLCHYGFVINLFLVQLPLVVLGLLLLLLVMIKYHRAVLGAYIVALPVELGGVMAGPEGGQQLIIAYHRRGVIDIGYLGMTRSAGTYLFVCWVFYMPACIARFYFFYAFKSNIARCKINIPNRINLTCRKLMFDAWFKVTFFIFYHFKP